jgi:hypothetical protein
VDVHEFGEEAEPFGDIIVVDRHMSKLRNLSGGLMGRGFERVVKSKSPGNFRDFIMFCLSKK